MNASSSSTGAPMCKTHWDEVRVDCMNSIEQWQCKLTASSAKFRKTSPTLKTCWSKSCENLSPSFPTCYITLCSGAVGWRLFRWGRRRLSSRLDSRLSRLSRLSSTWTQRAKSVILLRFSNNAFVNFFEGSEHRLKAINPPFFRELPNFTTKKNKNAICENNHDIHTYIYICININQTYHYYSLFMIESDMDQMLMKLHNFLFWCPLSRLAPNLAYPQ